MQFFLQAKLKIFREITKSLRTELEAVVSEKAKVQRAREEKAKARVKARIGMTIKGQNCDTGEAVVANKASSLNDGGDGCLSDANNRDFQVEDQSCNTDKGDFSVHENSDTNCTWENLDERLNPKTHHYISKYSTVNGDLGSTRLGSLDNEKVDEHSAYLSRSIDNISVSSNIEQHRNDRAYIDVGRLDMQKNAEETSHFSNDDSRSQDSVRIQDNSKIMDEGHDNDRINTGYISENNVDTPRISLPCLSSVKLSSSIATLAANKAHLFQTTTNEETFGDDSTDDDSTNDDDQD